VRFLRNALAGALLLPIHLGSQQAGNARVPEVRRDSRLGLTSTRLRGDYRLYVWGIGLRIPSELVAYGPYCDSAGICGSSHGFYGFLTSDSTATVSLFAQSVTDSNIDDEELIFLGGPVAREHLSIIKRADTKLGPLRATRLLINFRDQKTLEPWIWDVVYARRVLPKDGTFLYEVTLTASEKRYVQDKRIIELIINSFRTISVE